MTTVMTGSTGHVGANFVRRMLDQGRDFRAVVRDDLRAFEGLKVETVRADVRDRASLVRAFQGAETVFHMAAVISITGPQGGLVHDTNVTGVANVVSACLECKVKRLVHFSSIHAFNQKPLDRPLDETREFVGPKAYAYDRSKALGHMEVLKGVEKGLDATVVHPCAVLGPHDYKPSRMGKFMIDLHQGNFPALLKGGFNWVDVDDVIDGALAAETKGRTGENYLLPGHYLTIPELAGVVHDVTGVKIPGWASPMWLAGIAAPFSTWSAKRKGKMPLFTREALGALKANHNVLYEKAKRELGYEPRPIKTTIENIFEWLEETGRL